MKEFEVKNLIIEWLQAMGAFVWVTQSMGVYDPRRGVYRKWVGPGKIKGVSDIIGIWNGRPLAIEVKTKTGVIRPEQTEFLQQFNIAGGIGFVAHSLEEVITYLNASGTELGNS